MTKTRSGIMSMKGMAKAVLLGVAAFALTEGRAPAGFGLGMTGAVKNQVDEIDKEAAKKAGRFISGTAAAGAPIVGTVLVRDSSVPYVERSAAIEAGGNYKVDVSDLTPPFMFQARGSVGGREYRLHSAATSGDVDGTINITPLTDLMIANIAGQIAENLFNNVSAFKASITETALNNAEAALQTRLAGVISAVGLDAGIDLLRASFTANHTGLDQVLDILDVEVDPNTAVATITNRINNQSITDDLASTSDADVLDATGTTAALTEFEQIVQSLETFSSRFATSLPAYNDPVLVSLMHPTFLLDGQTSTMFLSDITTDPETIGLQLSDIVLVSLTTTGTPEATVRFSVFFSGGMRCHDCGDLTWRMIKNGGTWQNAGNGRIAEADVDAIAVRNEAGTIQTGLDVDVRDEGARGIDYALVTGPAFPGGILLVRSFQGDDFYIANTMAYSGTNTGRLNTSGSGELYALSDAQIAALADGDVYTFQLYDDAGTAGGTTAPEAGDTLLATYTSKLKKVPVLNSVLAGGGMFPTITGPTDAELISAASCAVATGCALTVSWSIPSGHFADGGWLWRGGMSGGDSFDIRASSSTDTSDTVYFTPASFTVTSIGVTIESVDTYDRQFRQERNIPVP